MIKAFDRLGLPWIVGHLFSRLWLAPAYVELAAESHVVFAWKHMCQFDSKCKTSSYILAGNAPTHFITNIERSAMPREVFVIGHTNCICSQQVLPLAASLGLL